jgi:hypothetical protein
MGRDKVLMYEGEPSEWRLKSGDIFSFSDSDKLITETLERWVLRD